MADTTITGLPNATTPLSGAERVPMDQSGTTKDATTQDIANLAPATDLAYTAATRVLASSTGTDATLPLATTTDAGLQSAADKTKLDGITVDSATVVRKLVRNNSGVAIAKGQPVYQTGSSGTTITVALADASTEATAAQTLGLAQEAISDNATGWVIAVGELSGINTATLTEGQIVWLSETTGALTTTRPTQPAHGVVLGYCVKQGSGTSGILYVKVDNGLELDELHDVLISSPTAGQVLRRAADGLWKNATLAAADLSGLGTAAPLDVAAAGDASASQVVKGNDSRLSDSREWSAATIDQAEAEAGSATTRRAFTAQRVRQAIVAWWATVSGTVAASGAIGSSGLTMATARLLGRSTAGTGAPEEVTLGTGLSFSGTTLNATASGGGTKTLGRFTPLDNQPPATNFATLDTRNSIALLDYDAATEESAVFVGVIPEAANLTSGISVIISWAATSATSGDCVWGAQFEKTTGQDIDSDSFDTATTATTTTNAASGFVNTTTITCTSIDSLAAGNCYRVKVYRSATAAGDTMTGDAELVAVELRQVA